MRLLTLTGAPIQTSCTVDRVCASDHAYAPTTGLTYREATLHSKCHEIAARISFSPSGPMPPINATLSVNQIPTLCPDLYDGMYCPTVATLNGGSVYKFAQSSRPESQQVASPWWFTEVEFRKMKRFLDLDPGNVGFLARSQLAVKYEWSNMDVLITARIMHPIRVFVGPGKWQVETTAAGSHITFQAPDQVQQCYMPGIVDRANRCLSASGKQALGAFQFTPITSGDAIDDLMRSMKGKTIIIPGSPTVH